MAADDVDSSGDEAAVHVGLLGPFSVSAGERSTGIWPRPSARRLCELVLVSPGRRVTRDLACEELFPGLDPRAAARALSKALSMARSTLSELGAPTAALLAADLEHVWASPAAEVDAEVHEAAVRAGLAMPPGQARDDQLAAVLADDRELLADEPYTDWAMRPRERLEMLRQEARLTLARDRARGAGRSGPEAVQAAWESCLEHDAACEEAAAALVQAYFARGQRQLAALAYQRCSAALAELGLRPSPSLEAAYATASFEAAPSRSPAVTPAEIAAATGPARPAEIRTVSVLSAEISARRDPAGQPDPERVRELVSGALAAVIAEIEALGGTVTSVSGTGLQAVFGAPAANEDDPERAVRAAFRALTAAAAAGDGAPVLRIGLETGPAVLGPVGGGSRVEYGAVGDVVGTAVALQSSARPGSVLVGPATRELAGHLFTWGASAAVTTGPAGAPLTASYLGKPRASAAGRRPRFGGRGPLFGRQPELAELRAALGELVQGRGSVVFLTGEPGLGKTRLAQECRKQLATQTRRAGGGRPVLWLEGRCASYTASTPYSLYQQLLATWAGVAPDEPEASVRPALERALTGATGSTDLFPLLARMLGLPAGAALGRTSAGDLQRATFSAVRSLLSRLTDAGPVVLVLEDLHWADPTSLRLSTEICGLAADRPLLVLALSRPDGGPDLAAFERSLAAATPVRRIQLGPLTADTERALARSLIGGPARKEVVDAVLASAEGNPLFLEERLSWLLETGMLVQEQAGWRIASTDGLHVPQVLERLVRSRVDRLSRTAREVVRIASVLGAQFPLALLAAVCPAADTVGPAVAELCARDLLRHVDRRPEQVLRFRHALIQEAICSGLLRAERRMLHGRAAWALEAASQDRLEEVAAVLGAHFAAAGEAEPALRYLELAGDHATEAFANDEAISSLQAALGVVAGLQPGAGWTAGAAVRLQAKLAHVLWRTARRGQTREAFQEALRLADDTDRVQRAHLLTRLGRLEMSDQRFDAAARAYAGAGALLGPDASTKDDASTDQWLELMVDGRAGLHILRGEPELALALLRAAGPAVQTRQVPARTYCFYQFAALARVMQNRFRVEDADVESMRQSLTAAQGSDDKDIGYATYYVGRLLLLQGRLAEAQEYFEAARIHAERIGEIQLMGPSLVGLSLTALRGGDAELVRALAPQARAAADAAPSAIVAVGAHACLAWLAWHDREADEVIRLAAHIAGLQAGASGSAYPHRWVYLFPLIAARLSTGEVGEAVAASRDLLHASQQLLSDDLGALVQAAGTAWDEDQPEQSAGHLSRALALAHDLRYF